MAGGPLATGPVTVGITGGAPAAPEVICIVPSESAGAGGRGFAAVPDDVNGLSPAPPGVLSSATFGV
jgi:hypothetical protein